MPTLIVKTKKMENISNYSQIITITFSLNETIYNVTNDWFAFSAGGIKRAFKLEVGTGKILQAEDC